LEAQTDLERIRLLFEDLERKEELIALLDRAETADGVKIFIGTENPLFRGGRRDWPHTHKLCAGHSDGGLYRATGRQNA